MKRTIRGNPLNPISLGLDATAIALVTLVCALTVIGANKDEILSAIIAMALPAAGLCAAQAVLGWLRGPWPIQVVTLGVQVAGWYWLAVHAAARLAELRALPLLPDEAFGALLWHIPMTPLLWALGSLGYVAMVRFLERIEAAAREKSYRI